MDDWSGIRRLGRAAALPVDPPTIPGPPCFVISGLWLVRTRVIPRQAIAGALGYSDVQNAFDMVSAQRPAPGPLCASMRNAARIVAGLDRD